MKCYPSAKGRGRGGINFNHAEGGGGHRKFWGSFYAVACSFSHIEQGGAQNVSTL